MAQFLTRVQLLVSFLAVSVVIVAAAVSSGVVALRKPLAPDSPVTIRSNLDAPEKEGRGVGSAEGQMPARR